MMAFLIQGMYCVVYWVNIMSFRILLIREHGRLWIVDNLVILRDNWQNVGVQLGTPLLKPSGITGTKLSYTIKRFQQPL